MNARSQEREDELRYLDLSEAEDSRIAAPTEIRPWNWRDRAGVLAVLLLAWLVVTALMLGLRDEWHIIGRIFR
jgi:hypothetical protein